MFLAFPEVAERWNSCIRFSCLKHGYTVHTSFDMVPPFPRFLPSVQLKYRDWIVLNAGNFIHVLNVSLENTENGSEVSALAAMYHSRLGIGIPRDSEEEEYEEMRDMPVASEMPENNLFVSSEQNFGRNSLRRRRPRVTVPLNAVDGGESSSSDNEFERNSANDRRSLSLEDRDREWELLISNVPPRTSLVNFSTNNNNALDTDSASDTEVITSDRLGANSNVSLMFDMLVQSDSRLGTNSSSQTVSSSNEEELPSVTTRSRSLQRHGQPDNVLPFLSTAGPSSSQEIFNDEFDEATVRNATSHSELSSSESETPQHFPSDNNGRRLRASTAGSFEGMRLRSSSTYVRPQQSHFGDTSPSSTAESEYEFIDEIAGSRHEKLSVFRKRRLADKKYEFSDENSENLPTNYRSYRTQQCHSVLVVPSPAVSPRVPSAALAEAGTVAGDGLRRSVYERLLSPVSSSPNDVLRPINQNISSPILSPRDDRWNYDWDRLEKV